MPTVTALRNTLLVLLILGNVGTLVELMLLKHTDGAWQLFPLVLSGATLLVLAWFGLTRSSLSLRALQVVMLFALASGGIGVIQHLRGNITYAQESNPSLSGRELYFEAIRGSTPTLAPGMMVQLALIGFAFVFRHPRLRGVEREDELHSSRTES